jgi:hypothetical protein
MMSAATRFRLANCNFEIGTGAGVCRVTNAECAQWIRVVSTDKMRSI